MTSRTPHHIEDKTKTNQSQVIDITERSTFFQISRTILIHANHTIDIFTCKLEPDIVNHKTVIKALKALPRHSSKARLRILIQESRDAVIECATFVEMARKYSSFIECRRLGEIKEIKPTSWMTVDRETYISRQHSQLFQATACHQDKLTVRTLTERFDEHWEKSVPDPELRRLLI
ncbi:hypothetical protein MNBD_GAMMA12-1570 [hydrothermal vent metagenome]|uniref:DUF7931 domain-containing protein n=1 Tax=hydrothermal vent metagenome TaxID=652676 RepID=A0A3B0YG72_9ZZZZ